MQAFERAGVFPSRQITKVYETAVATNKDKIPAVYMSRRFDNTILQQKLNAL